MLTYAGWQHERRCLRKHHRQRPLRGLGSLAGSMHQVLVRPGKRQKNQDGHLDPFPFPHIIILYYIILYYIRLCSIILYFIFYHIHGAAPPVRGQVAQFGSPGGRNACPNLHWVFRGIEGQSSTSVVCPEDTAINSDKQQTHKYIPCTHHNRKRVCLKPRSLELRAVPTGCSHGMHK